MKSIRILSFLFRFLQKLQKRNVDDTFLTSRELNHARDALVRQAETQEFNTELKALRLGNNIPPQSKLKSSNPFSDENQILRVGGRLINPELSENAKHPIILSKGHKLTLLILDYFHKKFLHVGPNTLLHLVRQQFWLINGRNQCRQIVRNCVICFKNKPILTIQIMGNLPKEKE
ncbi:integrase catalytic domain-containing protein [Trichonephila clavipes]|nr:integrase catalytic domain-containing protein [Trichonephila clavipes]